MLNLQCRVRSLLPSDPALPYGVMPVAALTGLYVRRLHPSSRLCSSRTTITLKDILGSQKLSEMDSRQYKPPRRKAL